MKCVLLVAGYATRLYPLTRDLPKSLLPVGSRTILERILEKVGRVAGIEEVLLISNHRFAAQFETFAAEWRDAHSPAAVTAGAGAPDASGGTIGAAAGGTPAGSAAEGGLKLTVLDDGTTDNENRLGAVADLALAVDRFRLDEDLLVLAGDNLFEFELTDFAAYAAETGTDCICAHVLEDLAELRRTGVVELSPEGRVLSFAEKPAEPKSTWAVPPFYFYRRETLPLLRVYLDAGENPDAPGNFVPWLLGRKPVHAFRFTGARYDIGNMESYEEAKRIFAD